MGRLSSSTLRYCLSGMLAVVAILFPISGGSNAQSLSQVPDVNSEPAPQGKIKSVGNSAPVSSGYSESGSPVKLQLIADGLVAPIEISNAGDGSDRLFIVQQTGVVLVYDSGEILPDPFLDITSDVSYGGERGLLSIAFHPDYETNGFFYLYYTYDTGDPDHPDSKLVRYQVSGDPNLADLGTEEILMQFVQPYGNHNGGQLHFGPDGYLYLSFGDGGAAGDPEDRAQDLSNLFGAMIRIDVDSGTPYSIPPDNPFLEDPDDPATLPEIWAYGLRNPWRFSFDRNTGDIYIGDVGQSNWEEVDLYPQEDDGGLNFGWRCYEGNQEYNTTGCGPIENYEPPILEYSHVDGCAITGGYVYRGSAIASLAGKYLYSDYCSGKLWAAESDLADNWSAQLVLDTPYIVTSFGEDESGELYLTHFDFVNGKVYKIVADNTRSDFDGDGMSDPAKFYPGTGTVWWLESSTDSWESAWLGSGAFDYVPYSDFDGDGMADPGKFSSTDGTVWYIQSSTGAWEGKYLGNDTYTYAAGSDFDGDGKTDPTKLLPNGAIWYPQSSTGVWEGFWVGPEDFEYVAGSDFDGDGMSDPAKFIADPGVLWYYQSTTSGWVGVFLGSDAYDYVSASDFDGDGETDPAKFYTSTNTVWWLKSSTGTWDAAWLGEGSFTFVGGNDFDGDGLTDPAKYDPAAGTLSWLKSSTGTWDSADLGTDSYELVN